MEFRCGMSLRAILAAMAARRGRAYFIVAQNNKSTL